MTIRHLVLALGLITAATPAVAGDREYPDVAEPMVFDMVRGLGARQGELEANVLALSPLSGQERALEWAPEIEYAVADNFALEFELPFEGRRLAELKVGAQATFGTLDNGRVVHGVQYLGIYERESRTTSHAVLYLIGRRHSDRWSTMSMVGVGDVRVGQSESEAGLLVNHTTFYDISPKRTVGLEINYKTGHDGGVLLMPQYHTELADKVALQMGMGLDKQRGAATRPVAGARLIKEF